MTSPIPPVPGSPGCAAAEDDKEPTAAALPWGGAGEWAVVVQAGSCPADLRRAIERTPAGMDFDGAYGDVDVVLVYRPRGAAPAGHDPTSQGSAVAELRAAIPCAGSTGSVTSGDHDACQAEERKATRLARPGG